MSKRIAILGSTGSIGASALAVIRHLGKPYQAVALSAHRQADKLLEQVREFHPAAVALTDTKIDPALKKQIEAAGAKVYCGPEALVELVRRDDIDMVLAAVVGAAGLPAVLAAVTAGKTLALANKESLVVAGALLIPEARRRGVQIIPVDSEHSAIFQAMRCGRHDEVRQVILTASGGPFRNATAAQIAAATPEQAMNHPTWRMGPKVTIDSATLFNKGLELIEACWLFDLPPERVKMVIHPESIIHSMVEFVDGSVIAQLSPPDMKTPIQYALTYPERAEGCSPRMDWGKAFNLQFHPPDFERFGALQVAYDVARRGGDSGAVMNAANESAVTAFIAGKIPLNEICQVVRRTIERSQLQAHPTLDDLLKADRQARATADSIIETLVGK